MFCNKIAIVVLCLLFIGCGKKEEFEKLKKARIDIDNIYIEIYEEDKMKYSKAELDFLNRKEKIFSDDAKSKREKMIYLFLENDFKKRALKDDEKIYIADNIDIVFAILDSNEFSEKLKRIADSWISRQEDINILIKFIEKEKSSLPAKVTVYHRLVNKAYINDIFVFLKRRLKKEENSCFRFIISYHLLQHGDIEALAYFIERIWLTKYFSDEAGEENNWGKDINKVYYPPSISIANYQEANEFLKQYTNRSFKTPEQWESWYDENKDKIYWDPEQKKYLVK